MIRPKNLPHRCRCWLLLGMTNAFDVATAATKARSTMVGRRVIIGTDGRAPFVLDGVGGIKNVSMVGGQTIGA